MCGGAIISDFISTGVTAARSRRLTADYLWPELKKSSSGKGKKKAQQQLKGEVIDLDDEFEADFRDFKDDSDIDEDDEEALKLSPKPFTFQPTNPDNSISRGNPSLPHSLMILHFFLLNNCAGPLNKNESNL